MKRLLLIVLIICMSFVILSSTDIIDNKEVVARDCKCRIMVECYYPGYKPGIDLPFASKIVYSCAEAKGYRQYISIVEDQLVFFFMYPAKP